jgi:hypothetical protein
MAISYHIAELVQKITGGVPERKGNLLRAQGSYEKFLKLLDSYDVLGKSDARLLEAYLEDRKNFSTVSTTDAAKRREVKISRFKEEKELKRKLEVSHGDRFAPHDHANKGAVSSAEPQARRAR